MSSRDIDALVAEHVMGWKWMSRPSDGYTILLPPDLIQRVTGKGLFDEPVINISSLSAREVAGVGPFVVAEEGAKRQIPQWMNLPPRYSTDPAACQQVKDKMRADGWSFGQNDLPKERRILAMWDHPDHGNVSIAKHELELMAVCIAALRALGVKVSDE